jgi:hypothetical protein
MIDPHRGHPEKGKRGRKHPERIGKDPKRKREESISIA